MKLAVKIISAAAVFLFLFGTNSGATEDNRPLLLRLQGTVNPVIAEHIQRHLQDSRAPFAVIKMDTPGGLMESMRQIVKAIEASEKPVVVYVGESGSRAASAGAFIVMASDVAVMASGTNIGAAHPVRMGGETSEGVEAKAVEDARSFIKALAEKHSRNAEWAQRAVTESASITASEALEMNVIEYLVDNFSHLKEELQGVEVEKDGNSFTLSFEREFREEKLSLIRQVLSYISHPNIAYLLLIVGIYGLIFEATSPGIEIGAVIGGISILLAALALQIIPVNTAGVLLIILGAGLMLLDVWVPTDGILTVGGLVSFAIGSFILFDVVDFPMGVSPGLVIGATATVGVFFFFAAGAGLNIQKKNVSTGPPGMVSLEGEVIQKLDPEGKVYVRGEIWSASTASGTEILSGEKIIVEEIRGNKLLVGRKEQ